MSRLKKRISAYSPYAQTEKMPPAPSRKTRSRIGGSILVIVLLVDALVALPAGWVTGKNHLADSALSWFASSWLQTAILTQSRSSLPGRGPFSMPTPMHSSSPSSSLSSEVSVDTFQRPNQSLWGTSSGGRSWLSDASRSPAFTISDHMGLVTATSGTFTALLGPQFSNSDLLVTFSIGQFNGSNNMGAVLHWEGTTHWYKVYLDGEGLVFIKRDAAQTLQLGSIPFPAQPGQFYHLRVQVRGVIFLVKAWPADSLEPTGWELRVADPSATWTSGYNGVRMYYASTRSITAMITFFQDTRLP